MPRYIILGASRVIFTLEKMLAMSNVSENIQKNRRCVGASCSVPLLFLHPVRFIYDRYPKNDKLDVLGGIIVSRIEVITFNRRDQICIFMKHEDFGDHELHCVQRWVILIIEVSETHVLKDSE